MKNKEKGKIAYVPMAVDIIHYGHIYIINEASKLGRVVVGLLSDKAISRYKRVPLSTFDQRKKVIENIVGVSEVVCQEDDDYTEIINKIKPDYFVHGDDWKTGVQVKKREKVIEMMKEIGGELIEPKRIKNIPSTTNLIKNIIGQGITPESRLRSLKRYLEVKPLIKILEVHNGLTGRIVEKTRLEIDEEAREFDGMWLSSLTDSVSKGKPDTGYVDFTSRQNTIDQVFDVTTKPMVVDADNGGHPEHFALMVKTLERLGVSATIIEDKVGLKANSLFGTDAKQDQDSIEDFCAKISIGKKSQITNDFMIFARIESLILKQGMDDALKRAEAYIKAGADGILIHSKEETPDEIFEFCDKYNKFDNKVYLAVVPSTYNSVTEKELEERGVNLVIYANQLLRSAYPAMVETAEAILRDTNSKKACEKCMPIKEILNLIPGSEPPK